MSSVYFSGFAVSIIYNLIINIMINLKKYFEKAKLSLKK